MAEIFRKHRANLIITLAGGAVFVAISVFVSWAFFIASKESRTPIFLLGEERVEILSSERVSGAPIRVVREDGTEITGDLTLITFFFWNQGEVSIRDDQSTHDVLTPITIQLLDPDGEIIDFRVLGMCRKVLDAKLARNSGDPDRTLDVSFRILDQDEGFSGKIMFVGNPSSDFRINGDIAGVPEGIESRNSFIISGWELAWAMLTNRDTYFVGFFIAIMLPAIICWVVGWVLMLMFKVDDRTIIMARIAIFLILFTPLLVFVVWGATQASEEDIRSTASEKVPHCSKKQA